MEKKKTQQTITKKCRILNCSEKLQELETGLAKIVAVGTANPDNAYTQTEVLNKLNLDNSSVVKIFENSHIKKRYLILPKSHKELQDETQGLLLQKHLNGALKVGKQAILQAINKIGISLEELDYLCVLTSTGFLCPGLSAYFVDNMEFKNNCQRCDIVGMGCNAGLNGLNVVSNWAVINPDKYAMMVCVEICSAAYVNDNTINSAVVNSLFGDGVAATIVTTKEQKNEKSFPSLLGFESYLLSNTKDAMQYFWDEEKNKFAFSLGRDVPYIIGRNIKTPVNKLLDRFGLKQRDISHWIIHGGGKKVLNAIKYNLNLTAHDLRHTTRILQNYGNMSSGSFLFSYDELVQENIIEKNQLGMMITMGPGVQIETALLKWT